MDDHIVNMCDGKPHTVVIRDKGTSFEDEVRWLKENFGTPIMKPGDGGVWGGVIIPRKPRASLVTIQYYFLNPDDAIMFKLAMV